VIFRCIAAPDAQFANLFRMPREHQGILRSVRL
jgi:hypothetical protein